MNSAKRLFTFVIWLSLLLMGCATSRAALGAELAEPAEIELTYVHQPSGMVFPQTILDFRRVELFRYDTDGLDVSGGYNQEHAGAIVIATVYVYPNPKSDDPSANFAAVHFEEVKNNITSAHPDAKLVQSDEIKVTQGKVIKTALHALFRFEQDMPGGRQTCRSEAYLFTHGKWFIKYRVTYPESQAEQCAKDIKAFMQALKWPEGA